MLQYNNRFKINQTHSRIRFDKLDSQSAERYEGLYQSAKATLDTLKSFQSHQELVELKLQSIEDLIKLRPPSPIIPFDPTQFNAESPSNSSEQLRVPQIMIHGMCSIVNHMALFIATGIKL